MQVGNDIDTCMAVLREGGVIAFPTDTVYGMGADIFCERAVERIYLIKGRGQQKPFLINLGSRTEVYRYVSHISSLEESLISRFWPGQLTIVFSAGKSVPAYVLRGTTTIGIRIPDHPMALALLRQYPQPLISTSVNHEGQPPLLSAEEIKAQFSQGIDYVLGAGVVCPGTPSTIVKVEDDRISILRKGSCDKELYTEFGAHM